MIYFIGNFWKDSYWGDYSENEDDEDEVWGSSEEEAEDDDYDSLEYGWVSEMNYLCRSIIPIEENAMRHIYFRHENDGWSIRFDQSIRLMVKRTL